MSKYFGTDGFRGEANKALNVEHAYKIGRFLGAYYGREHKCSVGFLTKTSECDKIKKLCHKKRTTQNLDN